MPRGFETMITAIVTVPPYAPFIGEVVKHPIVSGLRLNTVMPVKGRLEELVARLRDQARDKDLHIDLKCRQLRVKTYGVPPFTEIELTHAISVETPVTAYFSDGKEHATVLEVQGNRLIMQEGPRRVIGPGESVNIPHPSLRVHGYLTERDREYLAAGVAAGVHKYMLSFFEQQEDEKEVLELDPQAELTYKIESRRGLEYIRDSYGLQNQHGLNRHNASQHDGTGRLMAARGDLCVELKKPHQIIEAMENIISKDSRAIAASRILSSFAESYLPSNQDISDIDSLVRMGYRTLMLGDDVCLKRESVLSALNLLAEMNEHYEKSWH